MIGYGDIGKRIAAQWQHKRAAVHTLGRGDKSIGQHIQVDLDNPATLHPLSENPSHNAIIYYLAPPPSQGKTDTRMENFLAALRQTPKRIVYISTSGVYGDCQGAWVNEHHPARPETPRSQRRLAAEHALQRWCKTNNVASVILRVGGIYGPGRLPLERLKAGMSILRADQAPYSNRIHADDLVRVCLAAAHAPHKHVIYNVSDGHPSTMSNYFITLARTANLPSPTEIDWNTAQQTLSPTMLSYLNESKRLDISKMQRELKITLRYPTLAAGLKACDLEA